MDLKPDSEEDVFHLAGLEVLVRHGERHQALLLHLLLLHPIVRHGSSEPADKEDVRKWTKAWLLVKMVDGIQPPSTHGTMI